MTSRRVSLRGHEAAGARNAAGTRQDPHPPSRSHLGLASPPLRRLLNTSMAEHPLERVCVVNAVWKSDKQLNSDEIKKDPSAAVIGAVIVA